MKTALIVLACVLVTIPVWLSAEGQQYTLNDLPLASGASCDLGRIVWKDAFIATRSGGLDPTKIEEMAPEVISYGCMSQSENSVLVIHSFVNGKPDDFLVVPKGWITGVTKLAPRQDAPVTPLTAKKD